jgi:hypothetical protein
MLVLMLIGCSGTSGRVIDSGCVVFEPIYISRSDVLTEGTANQILVHNQTWEAICD